MIAFQRDDGADAAPWPARPISVHAATAASLAAPLADDVLCAVSFAPLSRPSTTDPRRIVMPLRLLRARDAGHCWHSRTPIRHGSLGGIGWAANDELIIAQLSVPESAAEAVEKVTETAYRELLRLAGTQGYPYLIRTWTYLSRINEGEGDEERYRRFCVGRRRAIDNTPGHERRLPAATVIGMAEGGLVVYLLAARRPGQQIENPCQVSAWRYPRVYGPSSPAFSRAVWVPWADGAQLFVSGTASVVGHATVFPDDAISQLRQAMANVDALIKQPGLSRRGLLPDAFSLYLRDPEDLQVLQPLIDRYFTNAPVQIFQGDICRRDLLLEVEAIYRVPEVIAGRPGPELRR